jgi:phosphate transport system substrate-binding protein
MTQYGKCSNFGLCNKADMREVQAIPDGAPFLCQQCGRALTVAYAGAPQAGARRSGGLLTIVVIGLVLGALAGAAYFFTHRGSATPGSASSSSESIFHTGTDLAPRLRLSGSNTIGAELGPDLAQAWLASRGARDLQREQTGPDETRVVGTLNGSPVAIGIRAHGSATAFTDLANGNGDLTADANQRVLGLDGVAVIVNDANPVDSMTKDEVANIFAEGMSARHWNLYARDDKSGTWDTFKDRVMGTRTLGTAKRFEDSRALAEAVARDPDGIGFVGLPYTENVKVLKIAEKGAIPLRPNKLTVRTEDYPLSRRLYLYVPENAKPEAREFVRFALSPAGQDVVEKAGFVGQKPEIAAVVEAPKNAPAGYTQMVPQSDRLTQDFRFLTGSSELEPKAVDDLKRLSSAMSSQYAGRSIILIGFSDSTGSPSANKALSLKRAQAVAEQLKQEGITPALVEGFGAELPVADNDMPEGREKNRRVEVWLRK